MRALRSFDPDAELDDPIDWSDISELPGPVFRSLHSEVTAEYTRRCQDERRADREGTHPHADS